MTVARLRLNIGVLYFQPPRMLCALQPSDTLVGTTVSRKLQIQALR